LVSICLVFISVFQYHLSHSVVLEPIISTRYLTFGKTRKFTTEEETLSMQHKDLPRHIFYNLM